ncbi:hypothetical protein TPA0908_40170 [Micromonospora sp. AKA38]|nr:hypothetical protein TPA0908_40170 [Micromonospora sp. AKA38]
MRTGSRRAKEVSRCSGALIATSPELGHYSAGPPPRYVDVALPDPDSPTLAWMSAFPSRTSGIPIAGHREPAGLKAPRMRKGWYSPAAPSGRRSPSTVFMWSS